MSKRKGVSADEKRTRMLALFHERKEVFSLKELEKIAPKEKGITLQTVKETVEALVADNLVEREKVGSSIYFWSFPSKASNMKKTRLEKLKEDIKAAKKELVSLDKKIKEESKGKEESKARSAKLEQLEGLNEKVAELKSELEKYKHCDPVYQKETEEKAELAKESVNRWTDNIGQLKSYFKSNMPTYDETEFNKLHGINEEIDYVD